MDRAAAQQPPSASPAYHHHHHQQQQHLQQHYRQPSQQQQQHTLPPIAAYPDSAAQQPHYLPPPAQVLPAPPYHARNPDPRPMHLPIDRHIKREQTIPLSRRSSDMTDVPLPMSSASVQDDNMPATSDFVKKLYKMLEDKSFSSVVAWGPQGDCFVVKDMTEFTKSILPRMFKHSNFASFVRQLNKYDFHKIKNANDSKFGEQSWTFQHPDFRADAPEALENIKRKVPAQRKPATAAAAAAPSAASAGGNNAPSPTTPSGSATGAAANVNDASLTSGSGASSAEVERLQTQVSGLLAQVGGLQSQMGGLTSQVGSLTGRLEELSTAHHDLREHTRNLEKNYQNVLVEMVNFQRNMAQQDMLLQNLIGYFLQTENGKMKERMQQPPQLASAAAQGSSSAGPSGTSSASASTSSAGQSSEQSRQQQQSQQQRPQLEERQSQFLNAHEASRALGPGLAGGYQDTVARGSLLQMSEIARRAEVAGMTFAATAAAVSSSSGATGIDADGSITTTTNIPGAETVQMELEQLSREDALARIGELSRSRPASAQGFISNLNISTMLQMPSAAGLGSLSSMDGSGGNGGQNHHGQQQQQQQQRHQNNDAGGVASGQADGSEPFIMPDDASNGAGGNGSNSLWGAAGMIGGSSALTLGGGGGMSLDGSGGGQLEVYTVGHLMPRGDELTNGTWAFDPSPGLGLDMTAALANAGNMSASGPSSGPSAGPSSSAMAGPSSSASSASSSPPASGRGGGGNSQKLRVRRSTFVPGWAVPPRVLLVDDDAVNRKLSSKFLQVFGCSFDVAVDGYGAVNKMNLEKYDLVLMDIVMPKLDGVTATNMIRQFDPMTPIISMTSNSKPNDILHYYSSGMNDILPKPFTKEGLLDMLEKHLDHLKIIKELSKIPRAMGSPDPQTTFLMAPGGGGGTTNGLIDGRLNPLAYHNLSDEQYAAIVQGVFAPGDDDGDPGGAYAQGTITEVEESEYAAAAAAAAQASGVDPSSGGSSGAMVVSTGGGTKRPLEIDDGAVDGAGGKRGRFEAVE